MHVALYTGVMSGRDVSQSTDEAVSAGEEDCYSTDADT